MRRQAKQPRLMLATHVFAGQACDWPAHHKSAYRAKYDGLPTRFSPCAITFTWMKACLFFLPLLGVLACQQPQKSPYTPPSDSAKIQQPVPADSSPTLPPTTDSVTARMRRPNPNMTDTSGPAPNPSGRQECINDWIVEPGVRVGFIRSTTTQGDLVRCVGEKNAPEAQVPIAQGLTALATLIYPGTPNQVEIIWANTEKTKIESINLRRKGKWHTVQGYKIGTPLYQIVEANQAPVLLGKLEGAEAGKIIGYGPKGQLARVMPASFFMAVGTAQPASQSLLAPYVNAKATLSSAKGIEEAHLAVYLMSMRF